MKICYFIYLLFILYSIIYVLNEEKYEVNYRLLDNQGNHSFQYLECAYLTDLFKNQSIINLNQINYNYFNNFLIENKSNSVQKEFILNKIKLKQYLIVKKQICLISDDQNYNLLSFFKVSNFYIFNTNSLRILRYEKMYCYFEKLTILNLEYPYSKCLKDKNKVKCLNDCVIWKQNNRLSKYLYDSNQTGLIYLNYQNNKSVRDKENYCIKYCKNHIPCQIDHFSKKETQTTEIIIQAYPYIALLDYYIQLVGLIGLFLNIDLNQLIIKLIIILKFKDKLLKNSKVLITIINLILISILYFVIINDYLDKRDNPIKKELNVHSYQLNELNLAICFDFKELLNDDYSDNYYQDNKFINKTFEQLEKITEFNRSSIDIYLEYQQYKKLNINWNLESKIIYYRYQRCYQIKILTINLRNQNKLILSFFKLIIKIDYKNYDLYILTDKSFHHTTYKYNSLFNFMKKIFKMSKVNRKNQCINYDNLNCRSREECILKECIRKFYSKYKKLYIDYPITKSDFSKEQWNNLTLNDIVFYKDNDDQCYKKYPFPDCNQVYFEHQNQKKDLSILDNRIIKLNLYVNVQIYLDEETSIIKLLLDLLNIQIIIFGLNAFKLISIGLILLNFNFKSLINLLCLIGFSYHLWIIFSQIINDDLIYIQYYKLSPIFRLPNLVFCFINVNSTSNHKIFNQLEADNLFNRILYLNKLNEWIELDKQLNYSDNLFKIYFFTRLNRQCFRIELNLNYHLDQFKFVDNKNVVEIYFNITKIRQFKSISFVTKLDDDYSEPVYMNLNVSNFRITSELFELDYKDKFKFLKNPLTIFDEKEQSNNADKYLNNIVDNLENKLRIDNSNQDKEIDNLIGNYFNKTTKLTNKKTFLINNLDQKDFKFNSADFMYSLNHFKHIILITNEDNFAKLILNLINLVSFWYDLSVFDIFIIMDKIKPLFNYLIGFFKFLKQSSFKLFNC